MSPLPAMLASPVATTACRMLTENKTWKVLGVEVLGINLPKTAIVRNRDEARDVAVNEFGNTVGFFGGLWGGSWMLDRLIKSRRLPAVLADPARLSQARMMKSFALIPTLFAFMTAMPFVRNAYTAWKTGATDYKTLITQSQMPGVAKAQAEHSARSNLQTAGAIMLGGLALGATGFLLAGSRLMFRTPQVLTPAFKGMEKLLKAMCLTGKNATEYGDIKAALLWGLPAYMGWMLASRDPYERHEQFLKMVNFMGVYVLTEWGVKKFFAKKCAQLAQSCGVNKAGLYDASGGLVYRALDKWGKKLPAKVLEAVKWENFKHISGFGLTVLLMGTLPALLNIHLTNRRMARDHAAQTEQNRQRQAQQQLLAQWLQARPGQPASTVYRG